jgi:hypothetical protein
VNSGADVRGNYSSKGVVVVEFNIIRTWGGFLCILKPRLQRAVCEYSLWISSKYKKLQ